MTFLLAAFSIVSTFGSRTGTCYQVGPDVNNDQRFAFEVMQLGQHIVGQCELFVTRAIPANGVLKRVDVDADKKDDREDDLHRRVDAHQAAPRRHIPSHQHHLDEQHQQ